MLSVLFKRTCSAIYIRAISLHGHQQPWAPRELICTPSAGYLIRGVATNHEIIRAKIWLLPASPTHRYNTHVFTQRELPRCLQSQGQGQNCKYIQQNIYLSILVEKCPESYTELGYIKTAGKRKSNLNHLMVRSKAILDWKRETNPLRVLARAEDQTRWSEWSPQDASTDSRREIAKLGI